MADFKIDVGFNTEELKQATAEIGGVGAGAPKGEGGGVSGIGKAIKAGLMATGIIGILANLRIILDTIGFILALISSLIGLLVVKTVEFIKSFFSNFERNMLKTGLFIVNGVIASIEWLANALRFVFTLGQQGLGTEKQFEFGRFQEEIILEAFDNLKEVEKNVEKGTQGLDDLVQAQKDYVAGTINSFMTKSEFENIKALKEENNSNFIETLRLIDESGVDISTAIAFGSNQVVSNADSAFSAISNTLAYLQRKAESVQAGSRYEKARENIEFVGNQKKTWFEKIFDFTTGKKEDD